MVCIILGFHRFQCPAAQGPVQPVRRFRLETHRNVANSRSLKSRKGLRRQTSSVLHAPSAPPVMALPYESPTVPVGGSMPNFPDPGGVHETDAPPRHGRNGARDRPRRHARRPMIPPVPAPAAAPPPRTRVPRGQARRPCPRRSGGDGHGRRTSRIADSRMTFITRPRPISAGSQPRANDWACVLRYPYTTVASALSRQRRSVSGAPPPDPWRPVRPSWPPTDTSRATPSAA